MLKRSFKYPPKKKDINYIFSANLDELVEESFPNYEEQHPIFKKFGEMNYTGEGWVFNEGWKNFSELEKWKYIALCSLYWEKQNSKWYEEAQYELYKYQLLDWAKEDPKFLDIYNQLVEMEKEM